jgi:hypothetical protein
LDGLRSIGFTASSTGEFNQHMIISASRRTDIPAFYAEWFINRIRAGYCTVPNPFNQKQISKVTLHPEDVDVIVFWTRNPKPFFPYLDELDQRGFRYYFQYTLLGYPREIDTKSPDRDAALSIFRELANRVGPDRMIWRYDPIVFSQLTGASYHTENYTQIATALNGYTFRSVISVMDMYAKFRKRIVKLNQEGVGIVAYDGAKSQRFEDLMQTFVRTATENRMQIQSCAEELDLTVYGIQPGKCVDDEFIQATFGIEVGHQKDPGQRKACGCVVSRDIGIYDSCQFGCQYCYATGNFVRAKENYEQHDPKSPSLIGWYDLKTSGE